MSVTQQIIMVAAGVAATMLTRFIPFVAFRPDKSTPKYILYLGRVLPASVFALLVVYCLRHVISVTKTAAMSDWHLVFSADASVQLISVSCTLLVHRWKRNMMLSIAAGTVCYMLLVRL